MSLTLLHSHPAAIKAPAPSRSLLALFGASSSSSSSSSSNTSSSRKVKSSKTSSTRKTISYPVLQRSSHDFEYAPRPPRDSLASVGSNESESDSSPPRYSSLDETRHVTAGRREEESVRGRGRGVESGDEVEVQMRGWDRQIRAEKQRRLRSEDVAIEQSLRQLGF